MKLTSERTSPENSQLNLEEHLIFLLHKKSYQFVLNEVTGKEVLDIGCGEGYGVKMLSADAKRIVGIDVSLDTIENAKKKYPAANIAFQLINQNENGRLPFTDKSFDIVVSFQVIEHVDNVDVYLQEISRVLKKGGVFYLATPNAQSRLLSFQNPWNKHHLKEYTQKDLTNILKKYFSDIELYALTFKEPYLSIENKRAARNKWILWPVTNKLIPQKLRQMLLQSIWDFVHKVPQNSIKQKSWPDTEAVLINKEGLKKAPCLIGRCAT